MVEKTGVNLIRALGLEPTKDKPKLFSFGKTIFILEAELTLATVLSENGFTAQRLNKKKGKLHQYFLLDQEALININKYGAGGDRPITQGFLFWGH